MSETEQEPLSSPLPAVEQSTTSPEKTELQELRKNLSLPDEVIGKINTHKKVELIIEDLQEIQQEIQKANYTKENIPEDIKKRIESTLGDYGILNINFKSGFSEKEDKLSNQLQTVEKNVQSVKDLSPDIVNTELESLKKTSPLPDDVATTIAEKTKKQINEIFLVVGINNDLMAGKKYEKRGKGDIDFIPSNVRRFQIEQVGTVGAAFVLPETSLQTIQYGTTTIESEIYAVKLGVQHIIIPQQSVTNLDEERQDLINFFAANKITLELIDIDAFRIFYLKNGTRVSTTNIIDTILERF